MLSLSYNSIGDSCTPSITRLVSHLPALISLKLAGCDFTVHFFQQNRMALAQAMKGRWKTCWHDNVWPDLMYA